MANEFLTHCIAGNSNKGSGLQEYKGEISIVSVWEGRDGSPKLNWCYPQFKDAPAEKVIPFGVKLGDRKQAIATLRQFLNALGESPKGVGMSQNKDDTSDCPF